MWYKDGFFWRKPSKGWEPIFYGFDVCGLGDLIFNTCDQILRQNDRSTWAYDALYECAESLLDRKRWPDPFNPPRHLMAKNWIEWKWSVLLFNLNIHGNHLYRPQGHQTRDPYIAFYAVCVHLGWKQFIRIVTIPWYLWRPSVWAWKRYLLTGKGKRMYEMLESVSLWVGMPEYARVLSRYMAEAAGSERILNRLR